MDEQRRRQLLNSSSLGKAIVKEQDEARAHEMGSQPLSEQQRRLLGASGLGRSILQEHDARTRQAAHG